MTDAEMLRAFKIIRALTAEEDSSVEIFAANPEYGGPDSCVARYTVFDNTGRTHHYGDSVLACLEAAAKAAGVTVE